MPADQAPAEPRPDDVKMSALADKPAYSEICLIAIAIRARSRVWGVAEHWEDTHEHIARRHWRQWYCDPALRMYIPSI
jgi:hypothetical protein